MKTVSYFPSKDELLLKLCPIAGKSNKRIGPFKLWWDDEGNICALNIRAFTHELEEFKRSLNAVQLGGIWKGVKIRDEDIREGREDLLGKIEEKW